MGAIITQLCVGAPKTVLHGKKRIRTGIFKTPVEGAVRVGMLNIDGDGQADLSVHGGRDKAIYVYPAEHYVTWADELGCPALEPSQFGENLTVTELAESTVTIGDRYRLGTVTAEVAQPRLPCFKLGIRMGDDSFPQRFLDSGRLGFYLRVENEGIVAAGDAFELVSRPDHGITVHELWQTVFRQRVSGQQAARVLQHLPHLDAGWRRRLQVRR